MAADALPVRRGLVIPASEIQERFSTSGGPGGQHANRVATRVELSFDVRASGALDERDRQRLMERIGPVVRVACDEERSQSRNRSLARRRLREQLLDALTVQRSRRPTRPTRASQRRRVDAKRQRSQLKATRRPPRRDD